MLRWMIKILHDPSHPHQPCVQKSPAHPLISMLLGCLGSCRISMTRAVGFLGAGLCINVKNRGGKGMGL